MEKYIKNSALLVVAFYAVYAAIIGVMYVLNQLNQNTVGDWLFKGLLVAAIVFGLNIVLGFITQRGK